MLAPRSYFKSLCKSLFAEFQNKKPFWPLQAIKKPSPSAQVSSAYLDQVSDARWRPEDDPLVHRHRLLAIVLLNGDVAPEEEQREWGHLGAVVEEDLR